MLWIGLTGGIATGKSSVSKILQKNDIPIVDADKIYHELIYPGRKAYKAIVSEFGSEILSINGEIDRERLGKIVFRDRKKLAKLGSLVHPLISERTEEIKETLVEKGTQFAINDVPLLYENKLESMYRFVALVYCPESVQIKRLMKRDSLNETQVNQRLAAQISIEDKMRIADFIIDNSGQQDELESKVLKFIDFCQDRVK